MLRGRAMLFVCLACVCLAEDAPKAAPDEGNYLTKWTELDMNQKEGMIRYMKKRRGDPWEWIRCEVCQKAMPTFSLAIADAGCQFGPNDAIDACEEAFRNKSDPLFEKCVDQLTNACQTLSAAIVAGGVDLCSRAGMCGGPPSTDQQSVKPA